MIIKTDHTRLDKSGHTTITKTLIAHEKTQEIKIDDDVKFQKERVLVFIANEASIIAINLKKITLFVITINYTIINKITWYPLYMVYSCFLLFI